MTEIRTERLILRRMRLEDVDDLFKVYGNADAMRYWSTLPHESRDVTQQMVAQTIAADPDKHIEFAIEHQGRVIGKIGLWTVPEIGYVLNPDFWRRRLGEEAARAVIKHGFETLGLEKITADVDPDNAGSIAMLGKLGFVETGREKNTLEIGGKLFDSIYFALHNPAKTHSDN